MNLLRFSIMSTIVVAACATVTLRKHKHWFVPLPLLLIHSLAHAPPVPPTSTANGQESSIPDVVVPAPTTTPVWPVQPIVLPYPWPLEWTPILYAYVPSLTTSGQEYSATTLTGGIQPCCAHLTYKLYQVDSINRRFQIVNPQVYSGSVVVAQLRYGLCFVLSQEPSMTIAEMMKKLADQRMVWTNQGFAPLNDPKTFDGAGAGGIPAGPGCANPPPMASAADVAAAHVTIKVY